MKKTLLCIFFLGFISYSQAQQFGIFASALSIKINGSPIFYSTNPQQPDGNAIGFVDFNNTDLGTYTQNSGNLALDGAEIKTYKQSNSNVCKADVYYTIYPAGNRPGILAFNDIDLPFYEDCAGTSFPNQGPCQAGDQKWHALYQGFDLTTYQPGTYTIEVYYQIDGSNSGPTICGETEIYDNNNSNPTNYTATFSIESTVPVALKNFTAAPYSNAVLLKWSDVQEINLSAFEIERSTDGKAYTTIATQQAKGAGNYSYTDNNLPSANELFYRLKIVDADGSFKYSYVVPVSLSATALNLQLIGDNLTVNTKSLSQGNYQLQLYSVEGKLITNKSINVLAASSTSTSQSSSLAGINLPKAVYAVVLRDATGRIVTKNTVMKN